MIVLTQEQEQVVQQAIRWFNTESSQIFEIAGGAGVGKSVVLNEIVKRLHLAPQQTMPMAYTGQAAIIMRLKGFSNAKSIHSSLYHLIKQPLHMDEETDQNSPFVIGVDTQLNTKKYVYRFVPYAPGQLSKDVKLMIIDEGYMVPDSMRKDIVKHGIKILVAGDDGQLPPISGQPAFLTGYNVHRLTQLMRQEKNNPIIYLAQRARSGLPIHCGCYGQNAVVIEDTDITKDMLMSMGVIICGTNKTRDKFNSLIRGYLGLDNPFPVFGDKVICRNNNWSKEIDNISLANGLSGYIVSPVTAECFQATDKNIFTMNFLPDLLDKPFINLMVNYEYLTSEYGKRMDIKNNKFTRGELFEYAYALTTHLSQGAEYPVGMYYEEFLRPNIQNQLIYTGITRFKNSMIYVKHSRRVY